MTAACSPWLFLCNGANRPATVPARAHITTLDYREDADPRLVTLRLPNFLDQLYHLPPRILDLLELAAYVFAADRVAYRGAKDAVEYHAWSRTMYFAMKVRDAPFWNRPQVKDKLRKALGFMTGDYEYTFEFLPGHSTPPASLFDKEEFATVHQGPASVTLFSGGLDSLAGALERLETTDEEIFLISHRSGQPTTKRTQASLAQALCRNYPGRVHPYSFDCGMATERGAEETQRTRAFLFGSIAFAVAYRLGLDSFYAYENGVTSLNFLRRQELMSARASRTTHPKTHALMADFLSEIHNGRVKVVNPFWTKTKADVFTLLDRLNGRDLISSAVSCSKTFQRLPGNATHCGGCFQCVDRRIAAYAAGLDDIDDTGIYSSDIFRQRIDKVETRTTALDYVRQAVNFASTTDDGFVENRLAELSDVTSYLGMEEDAAVEAVWNLCHRHGEQVVQGLNAVRTKFDDLRFRLEEGSLLKLIAEREYLNDPSANAGDHKPATLETLQAGIDDLKQGVATVHKHVRGVPILQADLADAKIMPDALAVEIVSRITDILTPDEQVIWHAMRKARGIQKDALPSLQAKGIVKSAATLSRRVADINTKLIANKLSPCDAPAPPVRFNRTGGYVNDDGKTVPEELSTQDHDWAVDPDSRDKTICSYLAASDKDKAVFHQLYYGIEDEAREYKKRSGMKSD